MRTSTAPAPPPPGVYRLDELPTLDPAWIGGKAAGLARLAAAGFPVPATLVVVPGAEGLPELSPERLVALLGPGPYFVRSSFAVEDRAEHSYAGQGLTLGHLDRAEVPAAIARVWASWRDRAAVAYRRRRGLSEERRGAVVVQREVVPFWSGVCFSRSPEAIGAWARLEAARGYGSAIVGGGVSPRVVEFHRWRRAILGELPDELRSVVRRLRRWLPRLERLVGGVADLEWVLDAEDRLWLLQLRPARMERPPIWSAALGQEFWSGAVTRLMFATVGRVIERAMLAEPLSVVLPPPLPPLLARMSRRVFVNVGALSAALPVIPPWAVTETMLRLFPPAIRERYLRERSVDAPWVPRELLIAGFQFLRRGYPWPPLWQPATLPWLRRRADRWRDRPVPAERSALVAEVDALLADLEGMLRWVVWGMVYAYLATPLVDFLLGEARGAPGAGTLYHELPFDPVAKLDAELRRCAARWGEQLAAESFAAFWEHAPADLRTEFGRLLRRWAHRAEERDVAAPRWEEDPAALWALLRLAREPVDPAREPWLRWLWRTLAPWRSPARLARFAALLPVVLLMRLYLGYRERMRDLADRYLLALRRRLLALAWFEEPSAGAPWCWGWCPGEGFRRDADPDVYDWERLPPFVVGDEPLWRVEEEGRAGVGVSPGVGEGRAVWIRGPADLERFRPGDVLLAPYLDPSLSLVLENAAAAAFIDGGMLSHGAIIAREYGIPAIVAGERLREVPEGARVRVDGWHGRFEVLRERS